MSEKPPDADAPDSTDAKVTITPRHYQVLCGLSLAAIVLMQTQHSGLDGPVKLIVHVLLLCIGALGILDRARVSPVLVLLAIAAPHLIEQRNANQLFSPDFRNMRFLDVGDVLVCMASLTYFIGHYRLLGLRAGIMPPDRRLRPDATAQAIPPHARAEKSLRAAELVALIFTVPALALLAQFACLLLKQARFLDIDPRWSEFLLFAWILLLGLFLLAHGFRYWRRLQMDRVGALLLLQDIIWHETRGEQRRIQRWLAWKKLRDKKK